MKQAVITAQLLANREVFRHLLQDMPKDMYTWQPEPGKWRLLEIVCHLYDEEREDFRARVMHVLERPEDPLPAIDPQGWVTTRTYMEQDYDKVLNSFLVERDKSVKWLQSVGGAAWGNTHQHPKFGSMSAGMLLANWLAHDYLHFRQITRTKYYYLQQHSGEDLGYAGNW